MCVHTTRNKDAMDDYDPDFKARQVSDKAKWHKAFERQKEVLGKVTWTNRIYIFFKVQGVPDDSTLSLSSTSPIFFKHTFVH